MKFHSGVRPVPPAGFCGDGFRKDPATMEDVNGKLGV